MKENKNLTLQKHTNNFIVPWCFMLLGDEQRNTKRKKNREGKEE